MRLDGRVAIVTGAGSGIGRSAARLFAAEAFGLKLEVHSSGNSLMNIANLHVMLAVNNCDFFELIAPPDMLQHGMIEDITVGRDGSVQAPVKPGLGFEIDRELNRKRRVKEMRGRRIRWRRQVCIDSQLGGDLALLISSCLQTGARSRCHWGIPSTNSDLQGSQQIRTLSVTIPKRRRRSSRAVVCVRASP